MAPVKILACGVFQRELEALAGQTTVPFDVELLDAGLHSRPDRLHEALQAAIDASPGYERLGLLYGLCGRGAAGLEARSVPLAIPRTHDCVAVFLGSADDYREQFRAAPGTLYLTPGWFEQKVHPDSLRLQSLSDGWWPGNHPKFGEWAAAYGDDNATMIVAFLEAWRDNYQRIAVIDNGLGEPELYQRYGRELAAASGWRFETLRGRLDWIRALIDGPHHPAAFLTVAPGHRVVATHDARVFAAVPTAAAAGTAPDSGAVTGRFVYRDEHGPGPTARRGYGLGIDAGGTYTDAAILDFGTQAVVAKAKAPTTHRDLAVGVAQSLAALDAELLAKVELVSLSTTLTTNALVEDRGATVGLLLMPVNAAALDQITTRPVRIVPGRLSVDGRELEPVDPDAVREAVTALLADGVEAFAVSGYAGVNNPAHEQAVKALVREQVDLPVVCGHELTGRLNFIRRAHTAVLNARLMPLVSRLLAAVQTALTGHGVKAPLFVVRGDGSLLRVAAARERPIETILSGPAASVTGARFLTDVHDLIVVDIGGTTTDVAVVSEGRVAIDDDGAVVGPWQTSVTAADIMTCGLGGDSQVHLVEGGSKLVLGPGRVEPLSFTATQHPEIVDELARVAAEAEQEPLSPLHAEFFVLAGEPPRTGLSEREAKLLEALAAGPQSRRRLKAATGAMAVELLPTQRLESNGTIRRCALTPTDVLHVLGRYSRYNVAAARLGATILACFARRETQAFCQWVVDTVQERVAATVLRRELSLALGDPESEDGPVLAALVQELLTSRRTPRAWFDLTFTAKRPIVGIGAPAQAFVPHAAALLGGTAVVPPHAEVANAVGAITGQVTIRETVRIQPETNGGFVLVSPLGRGEYGSLAEAQAGATELLVTHLRHRASQFGTANRDVTVDVAERTGLLNDGGVQLLEVVVEGVLDGAPLV